MWEERVLLCERRCVTTATTPNHSQQPRPPQKTNTHHPQYTSSTIPQYTYRRAITDVATELRYGIFTGTFQTPVEAVVATRTFLKLNHLLLALGAERLLWGVMIVVVVIMVVMMMVAVVVIHEHTRARLIGIHSKSTYKSSTHSPQQQHTHRHTHTHTNHTHQYNKVPPTLRPHSTHNPPPHPPHTLSLLSERHRITRACP